MFMLVYICIIYLWKYSQEMSNTCLRGRFELSPGRQSWEKDFSLVPFSTFLTRNHMNVLVIEKKSLKFKR